MLSRHARPTPVQLICLPTTDFLFSSLARHAALAAGDAPDSLERALRPVFPEAQVRVQEELAAMGPVPAWYLIREPLSRRPPGREGPAEAAVGRAILDDAGTVIDADEPVAALFGLPRSELIGMHWRYLHPLEVQGWFDEMMPLLAEHGDLKTRWLVGGNTDRPRHVDFRLVKDGAGDHLHGVTLRNLPAIMPSPRSPSELVA
jgi:PAS domain-containing protein